MVKFFGNFCEKKKKIRTSLELREGSADKQKNLHTCNGEKQIEYAYL